MNSNPSSREYLEFLESLVEQAGRIPLQYFRAELAVTDKCPRSGVFDPVTRADRETEEFIRQQITARYPSHSIVGEEFGKTGPDGPFTWLIDPIDGTRGFISGSPVWGVLVGLKQAGRYLAGAMRQPYLDETYLGDGRSANLIRNGQRTRLKVRPCNGLETAIVCCTHPDMYPEQRARDKFNEALARCRFSRFGTECLGYGMLAGGYVDLVIEGGLSAYDIAPLVPIIEGAGGIVTDWQGNAVTNGGEVIAAGDKKLHEEALRLLN